MPSVLPLLFVGLLLSLYMLHVNLALMDVSQTTMYEPLCQIKSSLVNFDCLGTFKMKESKLVSFALDRLLGPGAHSRLVSPLAGTVPDLLLDPPNALLGILYYVLMVCLTFAADGASRSRLAAGARLSAAALSKATTVFLAYKLATQGVACIVCIAVHVVNTAVFFILSLGTRRRRWRALQRR